jgi:hypothetical protein
MDSVISMQGEFGTITYSMYNKVSNVTHTLKLSSKPNYNLVWSFIYYFILYFYVLSCHPNRGQNLQNLKMNCGLIFILTNFKWIKGYLGWVKRLWLFENCKGIRLCGLKSRVYNYVFKRVNFKVLVLKVSFQKTFRV